MQSNLTTLLCPNYSQIKREDLIKCPHVNTLRKISPIPELLRPIPRKASQSLSRREFAKPYAQRDLNEQRKDVLSRKGRWWEPSCKKALRLRLTKRNEQGPWVFNFEDEKYPQEAQFQPPLRKDDPSHHLYQMNESFSNYVDALTSSAHDSEEYGSIAPKTNMNL